MQAVNAPSVLFDTGAAQFDVSPTGSLAYASGGVLVEDVRSLVWVDRTGALNPISLPPRVSWGPRLAPDGQRVGYYARGADQRVWISDLRTGASTPVTERGNPSYIVWSPDAVRVAFAESGNLSWRRADGGGVLERLVADSAPQRNPSSWSPDGKLLALVERNPSSGDDIWLLPIGEGAAPARPWLNTRFNESHPDWSPDGHWIAYDSDESGRPEVYVQPYPGPGARYVVSRDGGTSPAWARDGRELFYQAPGADRQVAMMSTAVTTTPEFATGTPQKLFQGLFVTSGLSRSYNVSPDGRRFIMVQPREQAPLPVSQIVVVQNWIEELRRLAPAK